MPGFDLNRMTWIKTNFLWMMYRSGWSFKDPCQSHVLAITISQRAFDAMLLQAWPTSWNDEARARFADRDAWRAAKETLNVRMQWDPDHLPDGKPVERRAIQLGLNSQMVREVYFPSIAGIVDITLQVRAQYEAHVKGKRAFYNLLVPWEDVYVPKDPMAARNSCAQLADPFDGTTMVAAHSDADGKVHAAARAHDADA